MSTLSLLPFKGPVSSRDSSADAVGSDPVQTPVEVVPTHPLQFSTWNPCQVGGRPIGLEKNPNYFGASKFSFEFDLIIPGIGCLHFRSYVEQ